MSGPSSTVPRSLLRHPDFLKLWTAETFSQFGTQVTGLAIPFLSPVRAIREMPSPMVDALSAGDASV